MWLLVTSISLRTPLHNVVAGDFNFIENSTDRISKVTAEMPKTEDRRVSEKWKQHISKHNFQEFEQYQYTCEHSHEWSRIDRIYTDLHPAILLCAKSFCTVLTHSRQLSDHSPISFGLKPIGGQRGHNIPTWVALDVGFEEEVNDEIKHITRRHVEVSKCEPDSVQRLGILKTAIRNASKYIQRKATKSFALTTTHKLACTLSYIRAVEAGDLVNACKLHKKYPRLQGDTAIITRTSEWYTNVKKHAVELMRSDISDRIQELKGTSNTLPSEVYESRKRTITKQLKRLLPAGGNSDISIIKDDNGHHFADSASIARILTQHWQSVWT